MYSQVEIERHGAVVKGFLASKDHPEVINWLVNRTNEIVGQEVFSALNKQVAVVDLQGPVSEALGEEFLDYCFAFNTQTVLTVVAVAMQKQMEDLGFKVVKTLEDKVLMEWQ